MKAHKKAVLIIAIVMAIIGIAIAVIGLFSGPKPFTVILGVFFVIAAYVAYVSGISYIKELEEKNKKE